MEKQTEAAIRCRVQGLRFRVLVGVWWLGQARSYAHNQVLQENIVFLYVGDSSILIRMLLKFVYVCRSPGSTWVIPPPFYR